jgi:two-component sensor histidine kinase
LDSLPPDLTSLCLDHAPLPMARTEGARHIVRYVNPAFCRLINKARHELVGMPFHDIWPDTGACLALLDRVYRTGTFESFTRQEYIAPGQVFRSHTMWPVMADEDTVGVMIQVVEAAPHYQEAVAMNEALILGSLRQHELTAVATSANTELQTEVADGKQRELDAQMLTHEIAHRIKNNLQIVVGLIGHEARRTPAQCAQGYETMQARIVAIAQLYDLISHSGHGQTVPVDGYLRRIVATLTASLLEETSNIEIEVDAEALEIDPERAVPFGLLVNELATNAVKHAFPDGEGRIVLRVRRIGEQIELCVSDNGMGMGFDDKDAAKTSERHGADYMAIFVRQLGGTPAVSESEGTGTTIRVRFPLVVGP